MQQEGFEVGEGGRGKKWRSRLQQPWGVTTGPDQRLASTLRGLKDRVR